MCWGQGPGPGAFSKPQVLSYKRKLPSLVSTWACQGLGTPNPPGQLLALLPESPGHALISGKGNEDHSVDVCRPQQTPSHSFCPPSVLPWAPLVLVSRVIPKAPPVHTCFHPLGRKSVEVGAVGRPGTSCGPGTNSGFLGRSTTCRLPLS